MKRLICTLALGAVLFVAGLNTSVNATMIMGSGAKISCGGWLSVRKANQWLAMADWALGWISASGVYGTVGDPLANTDRDGVVFWLDNYCGSHPADPFVNAVVAFVKERTNAPK